MDNRILVNSIYTQLSSIGIWTIKTLILQDI